MVSHANTTALLNTLTFTDFSLAQANQILEPLVLFVAGVVIYALFVFKFYRFIAKRDIFDLNLDQYNKASFGWLKKFITLIFYFIEYILLFPLFTFFWFLVLTFLLSFLSKGQTLQSIILISISLVTAVRVTAYYKEDLARDLAKMLPFALLGVYLVDASYFSFATSIETIKQLPSTVVTLVYYLLFAIVLEFFLRLIYSIGHLFFPKKKRETTE